MTQNRTDCHSVRGADGCLYALIDGRYQRVADVAVLPGEHEDETVAPLWSQSDSLSARMMIDPGDGSSARMMIDPGDGSSARMMIDPGDGAQAQPAPSVN